MATVQQSEVGKLGQVREFLVMTNAEMKKVTWPTRPELIDATKKITLLAVAVGLLIGFMDVVFQWILVDGVAAISR